MVCFCVQVLLAWSFLQLFVLFLFCKVCTAAGLVCTTTAPLDGAWKEKSFIAYWGREPQPNWNIFAELGSKSQLDSKKEIRILCHDVSRCVLIYAVSCLIHCNTYSALQKELHISKPMGFNGLRGASFCLGQHLLCYCWPCRSLSPTFSACFGLMFSRLFLKP